MSEDDDLRVYMQASPFDTDSEEWVLFEGGGLNQPVYARFARDGLRYFVTAIHIDNGREIRSQDLRFPLARLVQGFTGGVDAERPSAPSPDEIGRTKFKEREALYYQHMIEQQLFQEYLDNFVPEVPAPRKRGSGAKPPTDNELRAFAAAYVQRLRAGGKYGAVRDLAEEFRIDRTTAHKWLNRCRDADWWEELNNHMPEAER